MLERLIYFPLYVEKRNLKSNKILHQHIYTKLMRLCRGKPLKDFASRRSDIESNWVFIDMHLWGGCSKDFAFRFLQLFKVPLYIIMLTIILQLWNTIARHSASIWTMDVSVLYYIMFSYAGENEKKLKTTIFIIFSGFCWIMLRDMCGVFETWDYGKYLGYKL